MKNKNLISISGRKQSGKDTIGNIINYLVACKDQIPKNGYFAETLKKGFDVNINYQLNSNYRIVKFADKLKDIVCILLNCTREQLEDETFKNTPLGQKWWYYKGRHGSLIPYTENSNRNSEDLVKLTPRLLLQLLGTECGRNIIHPNIWVNTLMSEYKSITKRGRAIPFGTTTYKIPEVNIYPEKHWGKVIGSKDFVWEELPNWIITDTRFPNEIEAIDKYNGIKIKVIRYQVGDKVTKPSKWGRTICEVAKIQSSDVILTKNGNTEEEVFVWELKPHIEGEHISKTALDDYEDWDYIVYNTGSIDDLIKEVGNILEIEKII